jgi:hypothetical protein
MKWCWSAWPRPAQHQSGAALRRTERFRDASWTPASFHTALLPEKLPKDF